MHPRESANRKAREIALQYKVRQESLLGEERIEENLIQLLRFIGNLEHTPPGSAELQRRIKLFGKCKRNEGDTSSQFYGKLRHWLDRDIPQTKSPRHPERLG